MSMATRGENSSKFCGYFITHWGKFTSARQAEKHANIKISSTTITRYCKTPNKKPNKSSKIYTNNKTYKDLGYNFIPKKIQTS